MKTIQTLIRHAVTSLAGIGTYLAALGAIEPGSAEAANALGAELAEPLAGLLSLVAVVAVRLAMAWLSKFIPNLAEKANGGMSGGAWLLVMGVTAGLVGALPSCSPAQVTAFRGVPIRIGIEGRDAAASYSSKGGLVISARVRGDK